MLAETEGREQTRQVWAAMGRSRWTAQETGSMLGMARPRLAGVVEPEGAAVVGGTTRASELMAAESRGASGAAESRGASGAAESRGASGVAESRGASGVVEPEGAAVVGGTTRASELMAAESRGASGAAESRGASGVAESRGAVGVAAVDPMPPLIYGFLTLPEAVALTMNVRRRHLFAWAIAVRNARQTPIARAEPEPLPVPPAPVDVWRARGTPTARVSPRHVIRRLTSALDASNGATARARA